VLATLGARETPGQETSAALVEHLRARQLLLLLDNCEHVIDAVARLCDALLHRCPAVRLLTTSREVLGVSGETTWRVPSLALPDPAADRTAAELGRCESAQFFVDRALAVQPAFRVTDQNAAAVARICERLDGIPLALELAAARVRVLTVEQIDQRLGDRFRLLTGGGRTALRRQQTLRALVDWSHDLLAEGERALFRRLAVFAGGWSLDAAEAVCGFAPLAPEDVLDQLTALVDKSLVVAEPSGTEERYRLLETLRQYAQEKLVAADEEDETRGRHRDWCLALAERAEPELTGPRQGAWLDRLEAEHDNLRAALAWCRAGAPGRDVGLRLASPLMIFWYQRGYAREGQAWLEDALARGGAAPPTVRAHALNAAGFLAMRQGDFDRARVLVEEAMRLDAGEPPDRPRVASPRNTLAHLLMGQQQWERARELMLEELAETRRRGDRRAEALACAQLGRVGIYAGAYADAQSWFEQSIAVARARGDPFLV
jgi:predicted ATPase